MAENDIHVLAYAEPATDEAPIAGYEMVGAAAAQRLIYMQSWYIEGDARNKAAALAGRPVKLPYFFIGDPPEDGKAWPAHRRGGLRFMEQWIAARAGDKVDRDASAAAASRLAGQGEGNLDDHELLARANAENEMLEGKLKAERKTTRALRREMKELREGHTEALDANRATTERNEMQAATINGLDKRTSAMRKALVQVEDRVSVALDLLEKIQRVETWDTPQREHIVAELTSARALAREVVPSSYSGDGAKA